jgi:low affinity Fe/Cu permease
MQRKLDELLKVSEPEEKVGVEQKLEDLITTQKALLQQNSELHVDMNRLR